MPEELDADVGRAAYDGRDWAHAYAHYRARDAESPLDPEDLERMATSAYLLGDDRTCIEVLSRAHQEHLRREDPLSAARCAFWISYTHMMNRGEVAQSKGWLGRAQRLIDGTGQEDCAVRGYLMFEAALGDLFAGQASAAHPVFEQVVEMGERFRDPDLHALGLLGLGQTYLAQGEMVRGVACLDEVMVAVTSSEVSAVVAGLVYCAVIDCCQEIYDVSRAREWTGALSQWCAAQPGLVAYRGQCLVHRAEILQMRGDWAEATEEAEKARQRFTDPPGQPALGAAMYRKAELHRLRGELAEAADGYAGASQWGHDPQPGLALLRLAQGRLDAARAGIERALEETVEPIRTPRLLAAATEIALVAGDVPAARAHADELARIADRFGENIPFLRGTAAHVLSAVLLAEGAAREALTNARRAWTIWRELSIPYEAARARVLVARAAREIGDEDTAQMELDAARVVLEELQATTDLAAVAALTGPAASRSAGDLTARELEVLRLVAAGKTNRAIASDLFLSDKTVARHVANIFTKLGLSSRSAATAYAFQHDLVQR